MTFHFNQWLIYFYFYCICGWIFETTYVSLKNHKYINRGFMKGPWLPLYGSGAVIILLTTLPFQQVPVAVYFAAMVSATILEYVTGVVMLKLFKVRYWDYSYRKIQFQGHICLVSSVAWGFLGLIMVYLVHPPVQKFIGRWNTEFLSIFTFVITVGMVYDFTNALRRALDLRKVIVQMEQMRERMKERIEEAGMSWNEYMEYRRQHAENIRDFVAADLSRRKENLAQEFAQRKEGLAQGIVQRKGGFGKEIEEHVEKLQQSYEEKMEALRRQAAREGRQLLLHNPGSSLSNLTEETKLLQKRLADLREEKKRAKHQKQNNQ